MHQALPRPVPGSQVPEVGSRSGEALCSDSHASKVKALAKWLTPLGLTGLASWGLTQIVGKIQSFVILGPRPSFMCWLLARGHSQLHEATFRP